MSTSSVTLEEFLSTLAGRPSQEMLVKIDAALADPNSEIHAYIRSLAGFFKRAGDPDAIDWEACILPPQANVPDENEQRTQIRQALGEVYRAYWRPGSPLFLPPNRTIVDVVCARLQWFDAVDDPAEKLRVYQNAGEELAALRLQTLNTVADTGTNEATRSSAKHLTQELAKRAERLALLKEEFPERAQAFQLSEDAGRLPVEIADLLGITEATAAQYVREATVEVGMPF